MKPDDLARSACTVFGHRWGAPRYAARVQLALQRGESRLAIQRERRCERCGEVERVARRVG